MKFTLHFLHDDQLPPVSFDEEVVHVGTAPGNHVSFDRGRNPMVSRAHAQILADDSDQVWVYDNDSRAGTFVDGQRVSERVEITDGSELTFGKGGPSVRITILTGDSNRRSRKLVGQTAIIRLVRDEISRRPRMPMAPLRGLTGAVRRVVVESSPVFRRAATGVLVFVLLCLGVIGYRLYLGDSAQKKTTDRLLGNRQELDRNRDELRENDRKFEEARRDLEETRRRLVENQDALVDTRRRLEETQRQEQENRRELAKYAELRQEFKREANRRLKLESKLEHIRSGLGDPFAGVARDHQDGIYLIALRHSSGRLHGLGTCFLVRADGVMATNAHVVLGIRKLVETLKKRGQRAHPILIANRDPSRRFRVLQMKIHPDYSKGSVQSVDTAVIKIDTGGESFGPVLGLAPPEALQELRPGQPIALLGFPGEENNPLKPIATFKHGYISRLTTLQKERGGWEDEILVQHSVSITPGTSGSPILDQQGRVVAIQSSGLAITIRPLGIRFMSPARINWAIRVDKIAELLTDF